MVREFLIATYYFLLAMLYHDVCAASGGTLQPISRPFGGKSEGWPEWYQIPPQTQLQNLTTNKKVHATEALVAARKDGQEPCGRKADNTRNAR